MLRYAIQKTRPPDNNNRERTRERATSKMECQSPNSLPTLLRTESFDGSAREDVSQGMLNDKTGAPYG